MCRWVCDRERACVVLANVSAQIQTVIAARVERASVRAATVPDEPTAGIDELGETKMQELALEAHSRKRVGLGAAGLTPEDHPTAHAGRVPPLSRID